MICEGVGIPCWSQDLFALEARFDAGTDVSIDAAVVCDAPEIIRSLFVGLFVIFVDFV